MVIDESLIQALNSLTRHKLIHNERAHTHAHTRTMAREKKTPVVAGHICGEGGGGGGGAMIAGRKKKKIPLNTLGLGH